MNVREYYVYKHTPSQEEYAGSYEVCLENINNYKNNESLVEMTIMERFDPDLYADSLMDVPLVESEELMAIE